MGVHIYKSHNKTLLLYHLVFPLKYRKKVITEEIGEGLKEICIEISERYEINFVEIGYEEDHVHFLVQSVPMVSVQSIVQKLKSLTAREIFSRNPEVKHVLWGGKFWTSGFYINTVGQYGNESMIRNYVKNQGREYQQIQRNQPTLLDNL